MPVEKREPLGMSRDRANPVCFPGMSSPMRVLGLSNAMTCHSRSPVCRDHVCSIGQDLTRFGTPGKYNAKLAGWRCVSWQMRLSHVDAKGAPLGIRTR